jgi:putative membrane protein
MIYKIKLKKILMWFLPLLVISSIYLSSALAQQGGYNNWYMGRGMMGGWGMGGFGMIFMLIFWVLVIVGVIFLIRWLAQNTGKKGHSSTGTGSQAMDILKERYVRGDITRDQFETMKKEIL